MIKYLILAILAFIPPVHPDDRYGVATHFQQGWPTSLMPSIKALGVGWIRDNYAGSDSYYTAAHKVGLKVCVIVGSAAQAVTAVKNGWADAVEVLNEPNNITAYKGTTGEAALVTLTNSVYAAVGGLKPVIGLDEQGSEILYMLTLSPKLDGLVYHPYPPDNVSPTLVYEPPYTTYASWIAALRSKTNLPLWETEWGFRGSPSGVYTYALQSSRLLARLALTQSLHIEHTFIYEFKDNGTENYGLCDGAGNPKPAYYAVQSFIAGPPASPQNLRWSP